MLQGDLRAFHTLDKKLLKKKKKRLKKHRIIELCLHIAVALLYFSLLCGNEFIFIFQKTGQHLKA